MKSLDLLGIIINDKQPLPTFHPTDFPKLQTMHVCGTLADCTRFVDRLSSTSASARFQNLRVSCSDHTMEPATAVKFARTVHAVLGSSLETLFVDGGPFKRSIIPPLLKCRALEYVVVPICPMDYRPFIDMIGVKAWTNINHMNFRADNAELEHPEAQARIPEGLEDSAELEGSNGSEQMDDLDASDSDYSVNSDFYQMDMVAGKSELPSQTAAHSLTRGRYSFAFYIDIKPELIRESLRKYRSEREVDMIMKMLYETPQDQASSFHERMMEWARESVKLSEN